jgi:hypothetical protein
MRHLLVTMLIVTLISSCKKESSPDSINPVTFQTIRWSSADQLITSGADVKLSFNNTPISLRDHQQKLHLVWQDGLYIKYGRLVSGSWNIISLPKINASGLVSKPTLGMNSSGDLFVSWTEVSGINLRSILISRSIDGGATWSAPYAVKTGNLETPLSMYVFNRTATTGISLAWHDLTTLKSYTAIWNGNIWAASDWTIPKTLNNGTSVSHDAIINGSGTILYAAWEDDRSGTNEIYLKKSSDGGITWGAEFPLSSGTGTAKGQDPSIALSTDGRLHIAWHNQNKIYYSYSTNPGTSSFGNPMIVGDGLFAHLAINNKNMVAISWEHFTGSLTDDSGKSVGLLLSYDAMNNYIAPGVVPGSTATFYAVQAAVNMSEQFIDVFWIDVSDSNNRKLRYRYADIL